MEYQSTAVRQLQRRGVAAVLLVAALATAGPCAADAIVFHTRNDIALRAAPTWVTPFDEAAGTIVVADTTGLRMMKASGGGFQVIGEQATEAPIGALAAAKLGSTTFVAYNVRGEASVHIVPATNRGTIGRGPNVAVAGRPRRIVAVPNKGFLVVHSAGIDLLEEASAGAFSRVHLSAITSAVDAAVFDLAGDRRFDLIVADEPVGEIVVLRGGGDAALAQVAARRTQRAPRRVVAADIDGDGVDEVVVLGERGLSVHRRGSDGEIEGEMVLVESSHLQDVGVGDIDGDGIVDLLFSNRSRCVVSTLLGARGGRPRPGPSFLTGIGPGRLAVAALGGGTRKEIVVANELGSSLTYVRHDRRGLMGVAAVAAQVGKLSDAAAADFNGDGLLDLALIGEDSGRLEVLLGLGNGHFQTMPTVRIGMNPRAITTGDWDSDGRADLAIADFGADQIAILYGDGRGSFTVPELVGAGTGPIALLSGDFGGPTGTDLAVANRLSENVSILHADRRGRFSPGPVFPVGMRPTFLFAGDVNGDGREDLVTGNRQYETITILPREEIGFGEPFNRVLADTPQPSAAQDLDGNGRAELVVTDTAGDKVLILKGDNGDFKTLRTLNVGRSPTAIAFGDFDTDGRQDIAVIHRDTSIVAIFLRVAP